MPHARGTCQARSKPGESSADLGIGGAHLYTLRDVRDLRGSLAVAEANKDIPFEVKRFFVVFDVPTREVRGEHAHRRCEQYLLCLRGSVAVLLDDGRKRRELTLNRPDMAVYMPAIIWGTQYKYSEDAVLAVFASLEYDSSDAQFTFSMAMLPILVEWAGMPLPMPGS